MKDETKANRKAVEKQRKRTNAFFEKIHSRHPLYMELISDELHRLKFYRDSKETNEQHVRRFHALSKQNEVMRNLLADVLQRMAERLELL